MSENVFDQTFRIRMKPSLGRKLVIVLPHFAICILLIIAFTLSGFVTTGLAKILFVIALLFIVISLVYYSRLHLTLSLNKSIHCINKDLSNNWNLIFRDDRNERVSISASSFISNVLIILNFSDASKMQSYTAILTPDSVSKDEFRRLKVLVKTGKSDV